MAEKDYNILFGTGELFLVDDDVDLANDDEKTIEAGLTLIGESSGEAGLIIENEFYDVRGGKDYHVLDSFQISEEITFNAGIATLNLENLGRVLASKYEETGGKRVLKLGGSYTIPANALRFVHTKKRDGGKIIIDMYKSMNKAGIELSFNAEEHSIFDFEFTLMKAKDKENIVTITETFGESTEPEEPGDGGNDEE